MKTIFSLRRHGYLKTVGALLIAVALIAGVVGCEGEPEPEYDLTMIVNPTGGGTATDLTGNSPYASGTVVDIQAVAASCYRFVNWAASDGTFGNANNATTNFTMPAQDVTVTANFELKPLDHFKFYGVHWEAVPWTREVQLEDQFGTIDATVGGVEFFGNPVEKSHDDIVSPVSDPDHHLTIFWLEYVEAPKCRQVEVNNQFGQNQELTVCGPVSLAVPTQKEGHEAPDCLDHFLVYEVIAGPQQEVLVGLNDQFTSEEVWVYEPVFFANPVQKTHDGVVTEIKNEDEHLVFYSIVGDSFSTSVQIDNQISGQETIDVYDPELLAVPSWKISWEQPLNHFMTYMVDYEGMPWIGEVVQLEDQFGTYVANVTQPWYFANPVVKLHGVEFLEETPICDPRDHLMFYGLDVLEGGVQWREVVVDNQFGTGQWLVVVGPAMLIVPTEKIPHGPPEDLNHFLGYWVWEYEVAPNEDVLLWDQFTPFEPELKTVYYPHIFAVPAQKTHGPVTTPIMDEEHLLFYWIDEGLGSWEPTVQNQFFGPEPIPVYQSEWDWNLLGVPSKKISAIPVTP